MDDQLKLDLAKKLLNCMTSEKAKLFICSRCPVQDDCEELYVIIKRRFLPTKNEVEIKKIIEIIDQREEVHVEGYHV